MIAPVNRPLSDLVTDARMYWVVFKDIYLERMEVHYPGSDHPPNVRRVLDRFTRYCQLVARHLGEINSLDIERYVALRRRDIWRGKPIQNRTLNNEINIINAAFSWAGPREARGRGRKYLGLLDHPPFCELLPVYDYDPKVCTEDELVRFIAATKHATTPRLPGFLPAQFWIAALVLDLLTALRRTALLQIPRPDDCQLLDHHELVLPPQLSKTRREQRITLGRRNEVVELFASLPSRPGEPLLPWKRADGRPMGADHFTHAMAEMQRAAGIRDRDRITSKHFRSTAGTELSDVFGDSIAKKKLGHAPGSNTLDKHYKGRRTTERDRDASDHMAEILRTCFRRPGVRPNGITLFQGDSEAC